MHRTKLSIPRPNQDPPYEYVELDAESVLNALLFTTIYDDEPTPSGSHFRCERARFLHQIADFIDTHAQTDSGVSLPEDGPKNQ